MPNHPEDIIAQIAQVQEHIRECEDKWFEMEQSDEETTDGEHSIDRIRGKSHLKQTYCIPCTANLKTYTFDKLI